MPASPIVGGPRTRGRSPSRARGSRAGRRPTRCSAAVAPRRLALTPRAKKRCRTQRATPSRPLRQVCMMSCIRGSSHTAGINLVTQQYRSLDRRLAALASSFHEGVDAVATDSNRARMPGAAAGTPRSRWRRTAPRRGGAVVRRPEGCSAVHRGERRLRFYVLQGASYRPASRSDRARPRPSACRAVPPADLRRQRSGLRVAPRARARNCSSVQSDLATPTTGPSRWPRRVIAWRAGKIFFVTTARCVRRERSQRDPSRPGLGPLGPSHTPPRFGTSPPRFQQRLSSGCGRRWGPRRRGRVGAAAISRAGRPSRSWCCARRRER